MSEVINLCNIVSNKFNNTKKEVLIKDEKLFLKHALYQGLIGIVADSDIKDKLSKEVYHKLMGFFMSYVVTDKKQTTLIKEIKALLLKENITHVFLKGSHLKNLYAESFYRGMGDIDILVKKSDLERVNKLFNNHKIKLVSRSLAHNIYLSKEEVNVEVHGGINDLENKAYSLFLSSIFNYVDNNKLNYEYELVYLVYHLAKHLKAGGIGLRSVLDIAVFYKFYEQEINSQVLEKLLKETNLFVLFNLLLIINNNYFGYNFKINLENGEKHEDLLAYIISAGIHGSSGVNQMDSRTANKGKARLLFSRIFPSFKEMKGLYPSLKYLFILLPFYYLFRIIKLLLNPKKNLKKLKDIKASDNQKLKELFAEIGI